MLAWDGGSEGLPDRYVVPVPTHRSSVHPLLGKTLAAPWTSVNLSSSNCKKSILSSPANGCNFAGSYADVENISRAVGAVGGGGAGAPLFGGYGRPELDWLGFGVWTLEENVVELNRSADVV